PGPLCEPGSVSESRQTDCLSSLETRKATFLLALILIASPVAGLRPMRAARLRTCRMPSPFRRMRAPFLRDFVISPARSSMISLACFLVRPCLSASCTASWRVLMVSTFAFGAAALAPALASSAIGSSFLESQVGYRVDERHSTRILMPNHHCVRLYTR